MSRTVITVLFSLDGFHLPPWNGVVAGWACHRCRMASFVSKGKKRIFTQPVKPHGRPKPVYFDDFEILMDKGQLSRKPAAPWKGITDSWQAQGGGDGVGWPQRPRAAHGSKARPLHPGSRCHRNSPHTSPTSRCHRQIRMPPPSPGACSRRRYRCGYRRRRGLRPREPCRRNGARPGASPEVQVPPNRSAEPFL